ncbi:hypothetical protein FQR65_LT11517 [Abscondita terminalis]|nr:hypothetical protein FQR65_LT11517 [Abscondita terminalis]
MKVLLGFLFLCVSLIIVNAGECPQGEDPEVDILLPHETDCTKFYKCSHGDKILQSCPEDLHFSVEKQYCDWPNVANLLLGFLFLCVSLIIVNAGECPQGEDPEVDILLPHETDCTKFYKCSHGDKILQSCPEDLHFSVEKQYCDWPNVANCEL